MRLNCACVIHTIYSCIVITPRTHARARGYVIGRGVYILYIYKSALFFGTNLLSPKILTFRGPI